MRKLAREYEILFVADEVITAFGRLGAWFVSEMWDLQPDLMILAKGLTSGYISMGATVVSQPVAEVLMKGVILRMDSPTRATPSRRRQPWPTWIF